MPSVVKFPTKRKAPYRNPICWWNDPLPENVHRLRKAQAREVVEPQPVPGMGLVVLALIEALRRDPATWEASGGPDVLGVLQEMGERWRDDPEVRAQVSVAYHLMFARKTGRW